MKLSLSLRLTLTLGFYSILETLAKDDDVSRRTSILDEERVIFRPIILKGPEDVGSGHTSIIHNLQQRMEKNPPKSHEEYLRAISLATSEHLCDPFDISCNKKVMENTMNLKVGPQGDATSGIQHLKLNVLPENFDDAVMKSLEKLFFTSSLADLDEEPLDVLMIMNKDYEELKNNDEVENEGHRMIGLMAYAVGMESAKQWHEIFNNQESPFYRFVTDINNAKQHRRNQQLSDLIGPVLGSAGAIAENVAIMAGNVAEGGGGGGSATITGVPEVSSIVNSVGAGNGGGVSVTGVPDVPDGLGGVTEGISTIANSIGIGNIGVPSLDQEQINSFLEDPENLDIDYTKLLEADIIGASSAAIVGTFDLIGGDKSRDSSSVLGTTLEQATISSAKQIAIELMPPKPELCLFPGTALCAKKDDKDDNNEEPSLDVEIDQNNPQNCKHPNSPYCNKTIPGPGDTVVPNGCLFPDSIHC